MFARVYTPHSPRSWLPSAAAALGYEERWTDALGGWKPQGARAYIQTAQGRVAQMQKDVASRLRERPVQCDFLYEEFLDTEMDKRILEKGGTETEAAEALQTLRLSKAAWMKAPLPPPLSQDASSGEESGTSSPASTPRAGTPPPLPLDASGPVGRHPMRAKPRIPDEVGGYVVAITRGFRRLHLLGACPRVPGIDYHDFEEYGMERPEITEYDDYCKSCW